MIQDDHKEERRCCIAGDNGQRLELPKKAEEKQTTEGNRENPPFYRTVSEKFKIAYQAAREKVKNFFSRGESEEGKILINKKLIAGAAAVAVVCGMVCIGSVFFAPAYDVFLGGQKLGVISKTADFDRLLTAANETIATIAGDAHQLYVKPAYVFRIIPKTGFTSESFLKNQIIAMSGVVTEGYTVVVDGNPLVSVQSKEEAQAALSEIKQQYGGEESAILNQVEIKPEFIALKNLTSINTAKSILNSSLQIQSKEVVTYVQEVPFETQSQENPELYQGNQEILQEGQNGSQEVVARVTKINGVEQKADVLSAQNIQQPVQQVVQVGTKEKPTGIGTGVFSQPFYGTITSRFGARWGRTHKGVDIAGALDSPVAAADNGVVVAAEYRSDYGNLIILDHQNGMQTYYAHLNSIGVAVGDLIEKGQEIGKVGSTGNSTGPHLHFEVRKDGVPYDPTEFLAQLQ